MLTYLLRLYSGHNIIVNMWAIKLNNHQIIHLQSKRTVNEATGEGAIT